MSREIPLSDPLPLSEGIDVEYKGAKGGIPRDLWETYSAFANTQGGTIWLGVTQREGRLEIHGVPNVVQARKTFWDTIHSNKVSRNLLREEDVQPIQVDMGSGLVTVLKIQVPRADRRERPVYVGQDPFKGTYRRNHEGDYLCTDAEVRRMFADQSEDPADSRILAGFTMQDLDPESIRQYRNRLASRQSTHPWLSEGDQGLLEKLGGWRRDRRTGQEGPTLAGVLMFGKGQAIRDPECLPGFHLDYRERLSEDPEVRWSDRVTLDGTWEGNLFQFYQRVMAKLMAAPALKSPFLLDAKGYRQAGTPVHEALQEALVNALIHADHVGQGGVVLECFKDHLEFSNPGTLLVSREQLLRGGISECRNKSLQLMFQMLGVGDKAGSGIGKIRSSWAAAQWQVPSLRETLRPDRVVLILPMVSMMPGDVLENLKDRFGPAFLELDEAQVQVVVTAALEGFITNQRLQEMLPIHPVDITKLLQSLVRSGFLVQGGSGRWTSYSLPEPAAPDEGRPLFPDLGDSMPNSTGGMPNNTESLPDRGDPIPNNEAATWESDELMLIASALKGKRRSDPSIIRDVILRLCRGRYLTISDLAHLLERKPGTVRDQYVVPMKESALLVTKYPQSRHPDQAYMTNERAPE